MPTLALDIFLAWCDQRLVQPFLLMTFSIAFFDKGALSVRFYWIAGRSIRYAYTKVCQPLPGLSPVLPKRLA